MLEANSNQETWLVQSISGYMRPSYMAPCHITGRIAIAEDAPESSSGRSCGNNAYHWPDPGNDRK